VSLAGLDDERDILEPSRRKFGAEDPDPARSTPTCSRRSRTDGLPAQERRGAGRDRRHRHGRRPGRAGRALPPRRRPACQAGPGSGRARNRWPRTPARARLRASGRRPRRGHPSRARPRACSAPHLHRAPRMQLVRRVRARSDLARGRVGGPPGSCRRDGGGPPGRARRVRSPVAVSSPSGSHSSTLIRSRRTSATPPAGPCRAPRRGGSTCAFSPSAHGSAVAVGPRNQWRARAPEAGPASR
jgi:hypothetical protein